MFVNQFVLYFIAVDGQIVLYFTAVDGQSVCIVFYSCRWTECMYCILQL